MKFNSVVFVIIDCFILYKIKQKFTAVYNIIKVLLGLRGDIYPPFSFIDHFNKIRIPQSAFFNKINGSVEKLP